MALQPISFTLGLGSISSLSTLRSASVGLVSADRLGLFSFTLGLGSVSARPSVGLSPLTFTLGLGSISARPRRALPAQFHARARSFVGTADNFPESADVLLRTR